MNHTEIEVKFHIQDLNAMRKKILDLGALSQGRVFETNIRFEDSKKSLIKKKALLRLRKDDKARLTFKCEPDFSDSDFKILKEFEVVVDNFDTMALILKSLGFHEEQVYEKWRETFLYNNTYLCLDEMPYGIFLEIEGTKESILDLAQRLGLDRKKRIILNYLEIFENIRKEQGLSFSDITFEAFKNITTSFF
ncbi:adenylate cyclase, class 2 [Candidatus Magnetomoraceae bacterium gMMP-15]